MEQQLKWFTVNQNNSGGYWYENKDVAHYVSVQARNAKEALYRLKDITSGYTSYCECCGKRWSFYFGDSDGHDVPSYYNQPLNELKTVRNDTHVVFHYADGNRRYGKFTKNGLVEVDCAGTASKKLLPHPTP